VYHLYQRFARDYDRDRGRTLMERAYLDDMLARLADRPRVLDLGCGSGEPIARYLVERGCALTGVDAAPAMIALCRERFPNEQWLVADMRALDLEVRFDALIAWDSFFHLKPDDQRRMFEVFRAHIAPGGLLLFTSGPRAGEAIGDLPASRCFATDRKIPTAVVIRSGWRNPFDRTQSSSRALPKMRCYLELRYLHLEIPFDFGPPKHG
jgi:SAM-dependent methyltransferase